MLPGVTRKRLHHSPFCRLILGHRTTLPQNSTCLITILSQQQRYKSQKYTANMSWMDSWSRPGKSQATPVPYYLLPGGENTPYCHSCGRVIGQRKTEKAATAKTEAKYCSARCRGQKPGKLDREIERAFTSILTGQEALPGGDAGNAVKAAASKKGGKKMKGDQRILVPCSAVEDMVFGKRDVSVDEDGPARSASPEPETEHEEHQSADWQMARNDPAPEEVVSGMVNQGDTAIDGDVLARLSVRSGTRIRPPQDVSEVNGSVGGEKGWKERIEEDEEMLEKRRLGQKRAKEKEMIKCAARRGVIFGFAALPEEGGKETDGSARRVCEAVMNGKVVEPSFAKGDWSVRWRE